MTKRSVNQIPITSNINQENFLSTTFHVNHIVAEQSKVFISGTNLSGEVNSISSFNIVNQNNSEMIIGSDLHDLSIINYHDSHITTLDLNNNFKDGYNSFHNVSHPYVSTSILVKDWESKNMRWVPNNFFYYKNIFSYEEFINQNKKSLNNQKIIITSFISGDLSNYYNGTIIISGNPKFPEIDNKITLSCCFCRIIFKNLIIKNQIFIDNCKNVKFIDCSFDNTNHIKNEKITDDLINFNIILNNNKKENIYYALWITNHSKVFIRNTNDVLYITNYNVGFNVNNFSDLFIDDNIYINHNIWDNNIDKDQNFQILKFRPHIFMAYNYSRIFFTGKEYVKLQNFTYNFHQQLYKYNDDKYNPIIDSRIYQNIIINDKYRRRSLPIIVSFKDVTSMINHNHEQINFKYKTALLENDSSMIGGATYHFIRNKESKESLFSSIKNIINITDLTNVKNPYYNGWQFIYYNKIYNNENRSQVPYIKNCYFNNIEIGTIDSVLNVESSNHTIISSYYYIRGE